MSTMMLLCKQRDLNYPPMEVPFACSFILEHTPARIFTSCWRPNSCNYHDTVFSKAISQPQPWQTQAMQAFQEACEAFLVHLTGSFENDQSTPLFRCFNVLVRKHALILFLDTLLSYSLPDWESLVNWISFFLPSLQVATLVFFKMRSCLDNHYGNRETFVWCLVLRDPLSSLAARGRYCWLFTRSWRSKS